MGKRGGRTATVTTYYDGGGGNKVSVPEREWHSTRTVGGREEALVTVGGDSGGQIKEWVKVDD